MTLFPAVSDLCGEGNRGIPWFKNDPISYCNNFVDQRWNLKTSKVQICWFASAQL